MLPLMFDITLSPCEKRYLELTSPVVQFNQYQWQTSKSLKQFMKQFMKHYSLIPRFINGKASLVNRLTRFVPSKECAAGVGMRITVTCKL